MIQSAQLFGHYRSVRSAILYKNKIASNTGLSKNNFIGDIAIFGRNSTANHASNLSNLRPTPVSRQNCIFVIFVLAIKGFGISLQVFE